MIVLAVFWAVSIAAQPAVPAERLAPLPSADLSVRHEVQRAIDRGLDWLKQQQDPKGFWSSADHPAITGLALMAFQGEPAGKYRRENPEFLRKGYAFLETCARPDGGIYVRDLPNYNTSLSMMALLAANNPDYDPLLRRAREYLVGLQWDFEEQGKLDTPLDGGIGYGSRYPHSDMSNTLLALEALYYSRHLVADQDRAGVKDLNWEAALHFIQNCQNLPSHNRQAWASDDPQNKGGFVYYPGFSMAGETNLASGRVALRSYGSISYAGMLSYIYANLKKDDPRVQAVYDWLRRNYTLEENPGMGPQGLFYYYHTMAKALATYGVAQLEMADGRQVHWRKELALQLFNRQRPDGSWANETGRWWENDPVLVTAYAVLALEMIYRGL